MSISRRNFIRTSAGVAGAGLVLDATLPKPLLATKQDHHPACSVQPEPIPHTIVTPFGTTIHQFGPGPVDSVDPNNGHDPLEIFDFSGIIASADMLLTGTGTDLSSGDTAPYGFHADMRFMSGQFVAADGETHTGTFAFI
jgi:hypothetical protein